MYPFIKRVTFYKDDRPLYLLDDNTIGIKQTIVPGIPDRAIPVGLGEHRKIKGPKNVRELSREELIEEWNDLERGTYACLDILCLPTREHLENPESEVRFCVKHFKV